MTRDQVFNFSAGPSVLPTPVLEKAAAELVNYRGSGLSVMEMSHRSREFQDIFNDTKAKLRTALRVPETHEILPPILTATATPWALAYSSDDSASTSSL